MCIDKLNAEDIDFIDQTFTSLLCYVEIEGQKRRFVRKPETPYDARHEHSKKQKKRSTSLFHNTCTMDFDADRIYYSHQNLHQQQDGSQAGQNPTASSAGRLEDEEERQVDADALRRHFREFLRKFKFLSTLFVLCQMQYINVFTNDCHNIIK
jgi:hypothetical protein